MIVYNSHSDALAHDIAPFFAWDICSHVMESILCSVKKPHDKGNILSNYSLHVHLCHLEFFYLPKLNITFFVK